MLEFLDVHYLYFLMINNHGYTVYLCSICVKLNIYIGYNDDSYGWRKDCSVAVHNSSDFSCPGIDCYDKSHEKML